jgi:mannose-6-phosphate isomerase-like protein (cupin superfamily)
MRKIDKPWGYELVWVENQHYVGKILHINSGHRLSRQYHNIKEETFMIKSGIINLEIGYPIEKILPMKEGEVFHCPPGTVHRMCATTDVDVFEVSTPHLDDVVRLEDDYSRR